ncbi:MAG: UvrB/UvrC motif-containing protein [Oscillospiraceae bacterium]|jgi:protein-arginine kinase activator protein McsA|nr:UvrB/UvrC motif-containing protein [Oscillospiraceae bacterium]
MECQKCDTNEVVFYFVTKKREPVEVDESANIRRELNKQMRIAIDNEEFERAAEIRDELKALNT